MEKTVKKWAHANYDIQLIITAKEYEDAKLIMLKEFQKDYEAPGFRKGAAPLDMVEKNIKPEYISIWAYEKLINIWLQEILKEQPDLKLIGEPYDLKQEQKEGNTIIDLKLDIFPEVEVVNNDREKQSCTPIDNTATQEEIEGTLMNIKKQYADYQDTDSIQLDTISKIALEYLDKEGKVVHTGHTYVGEQEFAEDPFFPKTFINKKKDEVIELAHDEKKLPAVLHNKKSDIKAEKIKLTIKDVKKIVLPDLTPEMLKKLFWDDTKIQTQEDLVAYITESIEHQKYDQELIKKIEGVLETLRNKSMKVVIPQTLINEELKTRIKSLEERLGGKEKMDQYFKNMGDEKAKAFFEDITKAAGESLEKFFILQKFTQLLKLDVDRNKADHLNVEQKLYDKLVKNDGTEKKTKKPSGH
jgi:trigger factor